MSVANLNTSGFSVTNPDFVNDAGWTFAAKGPGAAVYGHHVCDPDRQRHVFEAVRDLYGGVAAGDLRR